ncbi:MAG: hypothetical protein WCS37_21400 [Chloroflexota bacterium]
MIRCIFGQKVLGEFGASGVQWPDQPISEDTIASYETVVWLWLW